MRTWCRAFIDERCGNCCAPIAAGDPLLEFILTGVKHPKVRCVKCADALGYQPPVDLPAPVARESVPFSRMAHIRTGADALPFDFKRRQGEREPGEDDD